MKIRKIWAVEWPLHVMMLPVALLLLVFAYLPMVGILIAFQDFVPSGGLLQFFKQDWVGLDNFRFFFGMRDTYQVLANTVVIALMKIIAGIVVPLVLALLLNEVRSTAFKRATQTIIYIPYFLSWVILGGILIDILSPSDGFVNKVITALGYDPIFFLGKQEFFTAFQVSVLRVLLGAGIGIFDTIIASYALSQPDERFHGRKVYTWMFMITMIF